MLLQFLVIPRSPFLGKERIQPFIHFSTVFCLAIVAQSKKNLVKISYIPNFREYFVEAWSFSVFNFFQYCVKLDFWEDFCHVLSISEVFLLGWQLLVLDIKVLFILLILFTVSHAICNCLASTESQILLIWLWMYSNCSFWYVLVSSFWALWSFCVLAFVGFLFLS